MKLFDRQKKWEINLYSYYDHAGIVRHLEDMARQGWQLEKAGSVFWTYRRCKPAELRFRTRQLRCTAKQYVEQLSADPQRL